MINNLIIHTTTLRKPDHGFEYLMWTIVMCGDFNVRLGCGDGHYISESNDGNLFVHACWLNNEIQENV